MKNQIAAKILTNSFIYSHSQKLIIGFCVLLAIMGTYYFESVVSFSIMIGAMTFVSYISWVVGQGQGFEHATEAVLESMVELGFVDRAIEDEESVILKVEDLQYFYKCPKENCCGLILDASATKGHKTNEGKDEELECS